MKIYTIGYEGRTLPEYIRLIRKQAITLIVDVRLNPISRKKGFSSRDLSKALADAGIDYCHLPQLGNPKEIRNEYHKNGSAIFLYEQFKKHLAEHPEALRLLHDVIKDQIACITCFEKLPSYCHRGAITEFLQERDATMKVVHL
ncbi:MAG: DUF488 domain-containing protein [Bacillota bacterium]